MHYPTATHVSRHLAWRELACHDRARTPYPAAWRADRAVTLARVFEALRAVVGEPLAVLSAYRTPAHNAAVGGAPKSQHVEGRAVDLTCATLRPLELFGRARILADSLTDIGAIGLYDHFIHLDTRPRPDGRLTTWDLRSASR